MHAMPVMLGVLVTMAIAYRYYSAFLAAKVAALDDSRETPALRHDDGHNYHPTSKWVLFGHHFAAISGAGPLIGPVLAAQFGYMPGLLWIVIGVCLAGAVQDFLVLAASTRREGRSLAQIAFHDIGPIAGTASMLAILGIVIVALAGLGKVVVKALGGEDVAYPAGSVLVWPEAGRSSLPSLADAKSIVIQPGTKLTWADGKQSMTFHEEFALTTPTPLKWDAATGQAKLPADAVRKVPGSSWGTFTIACTIPIALLVGFYMYRIRKGRVTEASLIGAGLTIAATVAGGWVAQHEIGRYFNLTGPQVIYSMAAYGFIAAVLPVWVLLAPRDYLSSFLKIGTIALLVIGTVVANPKLEAPAVNQVFLNGGPTVPGNIFPFLFITIMCGAISGFHALVSSGTTPKMITRESHARTIGYGAMLIEGLVGVVAMIAASCLPVQNYYAMNTDLAKVPVWQERILQVGGGGGVEHIDASGEAPRVHTVEDYERRTQESLRGRTGGAVTLAVGMAEIFDRAAARLSAGAERSIEKLWKYWYHFAIMFEALFILTTIDAGTRIGRFLLQELFGKVSPAWGRTHWWPSAILSTALIVAGWAWFMQSGSFGVIWVVFGISNQVLAVIALAVVSVYLANEGRAKYLWATVLPMCFVCTTTTSAAVVMLQGYVTQIVNQLHNAPEVRNHALLVNTIIQAALLVALLSCTAIVLIAGAIRIWRATSEPARSRDAVPAAT